MIKNKKPRIFLCLFLCTACMAAVLTSCSQGAGNAGSQPDRLARIDSKGLTQVIAFGDSYSDNGGANRHSTAIVNSEAPPEGAFIKPGQVYWNNRYSNGETAVEILAERLSLPLTNFATGGATSGETNYSPWMDSLGNTGLLGQVTQFEESLSSEPTDKDALYFIFASANDYYYFMDYELPGKIEAVADQAVDNIKTAVRRLSALGAENFFIVNSSDLTLVPYEITMKHETEAAAFRDYINTKLPKELSVLSELLDVTVWIFDMKQASDDIVKNAGSYGLSVLDKPCQPTYPDVLEPADDEDSYYFWDEWHYTRAVHKLLGEKMFEDLK